ncbi:MAG: YajQ family cyclic di-GMP-binding protein [Deltaproteobacteria bacterium RIFCSPLOWO2_12_FULL_50_11]|nr:MAG: YajQ family cyclic di-GMP-binding protein [Deltaproteobacteria bacterium RIFCSPHIGHO2_02_FULL_50_15]OGQ67605.1 MAG: YajQ family cyclic di-GMP-binding protein [Deltaproteobacteria bacterium RIFCSPLOWO2_12_FULL_50_11]
MPSFDVVAKVDEQEVKNAINITLKEILNRYDFRGTKTEIKIEGDGMHIVSDDDYKMRAVIDSFQSKAVKRNISLKSFDIGKIEPAAGGLVKCHIKLINGIPDERAKEMVKDLKGTKLKVQAQIQGDQLRITGKKKDDLQEAITHLKGLDLPLPLQFVNFKD